jgi:hypothetical protein
MNGPATTGWSDCRNRKVGLGVPGYLAVAVTGTM